MLGPLPTPNDERSLTLDKCSPWEIVQACIRQNEKAQALFKTLYVSNAEYEGIISIELVADIADACGVETMKHMSQEQIQTIFIVAGNKILNIRKKVAITRQKIRDIALEAKLVA